MLTYFVMLVGAMAYLAGPQMFTSSDGLGIGILIAPLFPCGLSMLARPSSNFRVVRVGLLVISYASFIAFLVAFIRARGWVTYGLLCVGFAVLLALNVAGCREMQKGLSNITMMHDTELKPTGTTAAHPANL